MTVKQLQKILGPDIPEKKLAKVISLHDAQVTKLRDAKYNSKTTIRSGADTNIDGIPYCPFARRDCSWLRNVNGKVVKGNCARCIVSEMYDD